MALAHSVSEIENDIKSYVIDRKHIVEIPRKWTLAVVANMVIPQGSILGLFLFIAAVNDFIIIH